MMNFAIPIGFIDLQGNSNFWTAYFQNLKHLIIEF